MASKGNSALIIILCAALNSYAAPYFQQKVSHEIHVSLDDVNNLIRGRSNISYTNNSPDTLTEIYFHLWPSAYQGENTVLGKELFKAGNDILRSADERLKGSIDSLRFTVNNSSVKWNRLRDTSDVALLTLNGPLAPGQTIEIQTPFRVKIPDAEISRLGHTDDSFFITQWYPKPAVYDKNGWNYFPYLDQGEYYSEFGEYNVYITVPENYIVAATGELVDAKKELDELQKKDSLTRLKKDYGREVITPSSLSFKTLHFQQENIHDFAWFADKSWNVLIDTIKLKSGKPIVSYSYFHNAEAAYWLRAPEYSKDAIEYYSQWVGEYPYNTITAVDVGNATGNGMEYPMIMTIGTYGNRFDLEITIAHEVGHNWFYGILGSNERCHPWMDEGINNFYETRYVYTKYKNDSLLQEENFISLKNFSRKINHRKKQYIGYLSTARKNTDQAPDLCADEISVSNYHNNVYFKTSAAFDLLKDYLGDAVFDSCMQTFYREWKFKHPLPQDLKNTFNSISGKDLSWIFTDLVTSNKKIDYKVLSYNGNTHTLQLKNSGNIPSPVSVSALRKNTVIKEYRLEGFDGRKELKIDCTECDQIIIDKKEIIPELYRNNNYIRTHGVFRKIERIKLTPGVGLEDPKVTQLFYFPAAGYNYYNKFMAGVVLHNISLHEKKMEFAFLPLWSFHEKNLNGGGKLNYHWYPSGSRLHRITASLGFQSYDYMYDVYENVSTNFYHSSTLRFSKLDSKIIFDLLPSDRQLSVKNTFTLRNILLRQDIPFSLNDAEKTQSKNYFQLSVSSVNNNPLNYSAKNLTVTGNESFQQVSAEFTQFIMYGTREKGLEVRFFGGYLNRNSTSNQNEDVRMRLDGRDGLHDYLFDEVFIGRSEQSGWLSQQFFTDYAGFKSRTTFFRLSEKWMTGVNVSSTLPGKFPFRLFASAGLFDHADLPGIETKVSWEIGVSLPLIKNIFTIYFPFIYSDDIKYAIERQDFKKSELIRFELHLQKLNPLEFIKNLY